MDTRELGPGHVGAAVALWEQAGLTRPWNDAPADFARAVSGPASAVLGGFDGDDLVATAMVGHDGHRGWVYYLAVAAAAQRNGHGAAMMAACERWLEVRGVPKVNLMVRGTNAVAGGFYDALGYGVDDVQVRSKRLTGVRRPTSHERMAGVPWDASYKDGPAPWDIGGPQPAIVGLAFAGAVLDAGCGTGENALHVAAQGLPVLGVDVAETAIGRAREKAAERGLAAEFAVADAFALDGLGRRFGTVLDSGLFHTCDAEERRRYVASLASVIEPGGTLYVLCFSDADPATAGPHPVSEPELRAAFADWEIAALEPARIETRFHAGGAPGWLATVRAR